MITYLLFPTLYNTPKLKIKNNRLISKPWIACIQYDIQIQLSSPQMEKITSYVTSNCLKVREIRFDAVSANRIEPSTSKLQSALPLSYGIRISILTCWKARYTCSHVSYCKFWIYSVGVNTTFTIWQCKYEIYNMTVVILQILYLHPPSKFKIYYLTHEMKMVQNCWF